MRNIALSRSVRNCGSLNSNSAGFHCGTKHSCLLTLLRFWQLAPTNRTHFITWLNQYGELAPGAFDRMDFDFFDFVRVEASHYVSQSQEGLAPLV